MSETEWHQPEPAMSELVRPRDRPIPRSHRNGSSIDRQLRRSVSNLVVRAPAVDWTDLTVGSKRLFRTYSYRGRDGGRMVPEDEVLPRPILLWTERGHTHPRLLRAAPMILTGFRYEPLGSITPDDVRAEGFSGLPAFRLYWKRRYPKLGWRPWDMVNVFILRAWHDCNDDAAMAQWALERLYGEWKG